MAGSDDRQPAGNRKGADEVDELDAGGEFDAPVEGSTGTVRRITGAEAQRSSQAEVFIAFEKALVEQGLDAAGAYMTPERLADMRARIKRGGEASFRDFLEQWRASKPTGEARRKQIWRVDVDGDYAEVGAQTGLNTEDTAVLVNIKGGWKIAEW